jgi:hypothetical protein
MSNNLYSNLPLQSSTANATVQAFDTYYSQPLEIDANTLAAMKGFFGGKGFDSLAAESISIIILKQAKKDGYNPMKILDTLKGLDTVEISALVSEILNYNRVKTSFLGYALQFTANEEVQRNILA